MFTRPGTQFFRVSDSHSHHSRSEHIKNKTANLSGAFSICEELNFSLHSKNLCLSCRTPWNQECIWTITLDHGQTWRVFLAKTLRNHKMGMISYPLVIHGRNIRLISFDDFPMENPTQLPWNFPLKSPWIPIKQLQWCSKKNAWSSIQKKHFQWFSHGNPHDFPMIFPWNAPKNYQSPPHHRLTTVPRQWLAPASRVHRCPRRW